MLEFGEVSHVQQHLGFQTSKLAPFLSYLAVCLPFVDLQVVWIFSTAIQGRHFSFPLPLTSAVAFRLLALH